MEWKEYKKRNSNCGHIFQEGEVKGQKYRPTVGAKTKSWRVKTIDGKELVDNYKIRIVKTVTSVGKERKGR